eukprot:373739_1
MANIVRNHEQCNLLDSINNSDIQQLTEMLTIYNINPNISIGYELNENDCPFQLELPLLHISSSKGNCIISSLLIKFGAKVNNIDNYGTTALHWAATAGHTKIIKLLLKHNANINQCDFLRMTALHSAAYSGRTSTVKLLIKFGADKTIKSNDNEIALDLAISENNRNCMNLLKYEVSDILHGRTSTTMTLENDDDKYDNMMDKIDISKMCLLESSSYSSYSTETSETSTDNDDTIVLTLKSVQLRNEIKALQLETKNLKLMHKKQQNNNMKQQAVKKQMIKEVKETKDKLIALTNKQTKTKLKINTQDIKIKALKNEKCKIKENIISKKYNTNANKLKKQLHHTLIILQKMNAENYRLQKKRTEIKQKQTNRKSNKLKILYEKQLNFNNWITDIVSLPFYLNHFEKYQYNRLDIVKHLDDIELKKIGINNYYHRAQFLKKIQLLKDENKTLHMQNKQLRKQIKILTRETDNLRNENIVVSSNSVIIKKEQQDLDNNRNNNNNNNNNYEYNTFPILSQIINQYDTIKNNYLTKP